MAMQFEYTGVVSADGLFTAEKVSKQNNALKLFFLKILAILLISTGITVCTFSIVHAERVDIAIENFAAKSWREGIGWSEPWYHEGDSNIVSEGEPHSGSYHMRLQAIDAWTDRPINLSGYKNARLGLYVKVKSFEKDDWAALMIKSGNDKWTTLRRFTQSDANNRYQYYEFDLGPYGLKSDFWIAFETEMDEKNDFLYVDDITFFTNVSPSSGQKAEPVFGITIDDISNASAIKKSLSGMARRPLARIVFDEYVQPSYYKKTVADLHSAAGIMGEILDSFYVIDYSQEKFEKRTRDYVKAMADDVDIWEVGNEINGEWLGQGAMDKAAAAFDIVKAAGEPAALTLYYNGTYDNGEPTSGNCWENPENQMQVWVKKNVPERMKNGLDWVFISFYEEDCNNISPKWDRIFEEIHAIFPNSKLGFGEVGSSDNSRKETIIRKYYGMNRIRPEFVGGFFWWYYKQDMVPKNTKLWDVLNECALSWEKLYE